MEPIQYTKPEHEIDLIEIITILWKAKIFIAAVTAISLIIGIIYIKTATPLYSGTITLYPASTGTSSPSRALARQFGVAGAAGDENFNIPDVVKSRTLSERIVAHEWEIPGFDRKINLVEYFDTIREVEKPDHIQTKEDEEAWDLRRFYSYSSMIAGQRIEVNANPRTGLIRISVLMENAKLASDIANFISVFVANWVNDTQKDAIRRNLEFINERAAVLGAELQDAENELRRFRETNRNIANSPDLQLEEQRLRRQVTLKQEVYLTMIRQRELNQIEENKSADVIRILDKAIVSYRPAKPNKKLIIGFTGIFGIIISCLYLMTRELYRNKESAGN